MAPGELHTERLILRPWRDEEADRLFDIRGRAEVAEWLGDPSPWPGVEVAREQIPLWRETTLDDTPFGTWAIVPTETGKPAGSLYLGLLPDSTEVHIGWNLHPDSTGHGYSAEAARAVLHHALEAGVKRIWAVMWPTNRASAVVARRAGMTDLGIRRDRWYGTDQDPLSQFFRLDARDREG